MKIDVPKYGSGNLLGGRWKRYSGWLFAICVVAILEGYVLKKHFGLWSVATAGIAGLLVGGGACLLRNREMIRGSRSIHASKSVRQIASTWSYPPRDSNLRGSIVAPNAAAETTHGSDLSRSVLNENTDVWFNLVSQKSDTWDVDDKDSGVG